MSSVVMEENNAKVYIQKEDLWFFWVLGKKIQASVVNVRMSCTEMKGVSEEASINNQITN